MSDGGVVEAARLLYEHDLADAASLLVARWSDASNAVQAAAIELLEGVAPPVLLGTALPPCSPVLA